jgi:hypothetical protein
VRYLPKRSLLDDLVARKRDLVTYEGPENLRHRTMRLDCLGPSSGGQANDREATLVIHVHEEHSAPSVIASKPSSEFEGQRRLATPPLKLITLILFAMSLPSLGHVSYDEACFAPSEVR